MTYLTGIDSGQRQQELTNLGLLADGAEPTSVFVAKEADAKRSYRIEFTVKPDGGCAVTVNYEEAGVTK